jgi:hypothetical protein
LTKLHQRVSKIENRCGETREVARIVAILRRASDEELYQLLKSGQLARMAERLTDIELRRLSTEVKAMQEVIRQSC